MTIAAFTIAAPVHAQQPQQLDPMNRAFDLERRGSYAAAVDAYRTILASRPADPAALLGLERSLLPLNRPNDILPQVRAALAAGTRSPAVFGLALRSYAAANLTDSLRGIAERWAAVEPKEEGPYREWGGALAARRDIAGARAAYQLGRERLGRPDAMAAELAQLAAAGGDYATATREWVLAIRGLPGYRVTALATLQQAPERERPDLLRELERSEDFAARRLGAELRARWGEPVPAFHQLSAALPADRIQSVEVLRQFLELLRGLNSGQAREAQALTLEALASRLPTAQAARSRLDAAQAYADAGRRDDARRLLAAIASDRETPPPIAAGASRTLLAVLIDEGKTEEAERRLRDVQGTMPIEEYRTLQRKVLASWVRAGRLARADSVLAGDSTVDGLALAGRVSLYRGRLAEARQRFQAAGPYAGTREEATERTALAALIQPIEADSLPALGAALLALEQGDSNAAVDGLDRVARTLTAAGGGAELRLLAGRIERARGRTDEAERQLRAADVETAPATAAAAELELGRLLITAGRNDEAIAMLEHMILTYPQSALLPQARRELDAARGAVPRT